MNKILRRIQKEGVIGSIKYFTLLFFRIFRVYIIDSIKKTTSRKMHFLQKEINVLERKLSLKNWILFESESDMDDNPRVFFDYLLKRNYNQKNKIIWIVKDITFCKQNFGGKNIIFLSRYDHSFFNEIKLNYYYSRCKWFIFSHPYWFTKTKKEQIVINTTHSVAQLKAAGDGTKIKDTIDYILCCNDYCKEIKQQSFKKEDNYFLQFGLPRLDLLFDNTSCIQSLLPNISFEKLVVSMETFKQAKFFSDTSNSSRSYGINIIYSQNELNSLDEFLRELNIVLIVKIHQLQDFSFLQRIKLTNIYYLTNEDLLKANFTTNQLLCHADILLTDYSSVFYDYLLLNRPIGFCIGDINEYTRGFIMDDPLSEMPGEKISSLDDLKIFLKNSYQNIDYYQSQRQAIKSKVFKYQDNHNCERLYNWIFKGEN